MRLLVVVLLLLAAAGAWMFGTDVIERFAGPLAGSEYERYAAAIRRRDLDKNDVGRQWLEAGAGAIASARTIRSPFEHAGTVGGDPGALAWRFPARRGQRLHLDVAFPDGLVFVDLLHCPAECEHVAGDAGTSVRVEHEVREDRELVLRVQPELLRAGRYVLTQRAEATLDFPVAGLSPHAVQSLFGAQRDRGSRSHEGVDIFAPRGTPVVAAADGLITGSTTNRLGGNVVWLWLPLRGLALYYAHLDSQAVAPGDRVKAGDVLGWVGNTGNARGTAPHLHFGVYARPGGAVDPLPYICDEPCAASRRQTGRS